MWRHSQPWSQTRAVSAGATQVKPLQHPGGSLIEEPDVGIWIGDLPRALPAGLAASNEEVEQVARDFGASLQVGRVPGLAQGQDGCLARGEPGSMAAVRALIFLGQLDLIGYGDASTFRSTSRCFCSRSIMKSSCSSSRFAYAASSSPSSRSRKTSHPICSAYVANSSRVFLPVGCGLD
jgi:hypothetical protein